MELLGGIQRANAYTGPVDIVHVRNEGDAEPFLDQGSYPVFIGGFADDGWAQIIAPEKILGVFSQSGGMIVREHRILIEHVCAD
jgi:hypothetical protein